MDLLYNSIVKKLKQHLTFWKIKLETENKPTVAAFDFDGTISYYDTLLPFLIDLNGYLKTYFYLLLDSPYLLGFILKKVSRNDIKEKIITRFFKGIEVEKLRLAGERFAKTKLQTLIKPEAIKRLEWHKKQGHRCVLISASIDIYLKPWSQAAGFDELLCTSLEVDEQGRITGKLQGKNCWGPEKVSRLKALYGSKENYTLYAYGDSLGDQQLLEYADYPFYRKMDG